jgi:hypothetical protein
MRFYQSQERAKFFHAIIHISASSQLFQSPTQQLDSLNQGLQNALFIA